MTDQSSNINFMDDNECNVREQDRFMPIANVIRLMRKTLPPHAKISDDAKETIQKCVSEYISFVTCEANDRCHKEQRKTITAEDVIWAMAKLGFDDFIDPLTLYLNRYRQIEGDRLPTRGESIMCRKTSTDQFYANPNFGAAFHFPSAGGFFGGGASAAHMGHGSINDGAAAGSSQSAVGVAALHEPRDHLHFN